jgi:hypothetical protein
MLVMMNDTEIISRLHAIFGNHSAVAKKLGYRAVRSWYRVRQSGRLPSTVRLLALRIIEDHNQTADHQNKIKTV